MTEITAGLVKELRERTGAGMMDCKKALAETNGDLEKSIDVLRKKGMDSASKKAGRLASEGLVAVASDGGVFAVVEVNSETDFVAKTEDFQNFIRLLADHVAKSTPNNLDELLAQVPNGTGKSVAELNKELVAKLGENISVRRFSVLQASSNEKIGAYTHMGSKIISLVKIKGDASKLSEEVAKDIAMHVAAAMPRFVTASQIPEEVKEKEKEIYLAQLRSSGKPENILEKIVVGKLAKFASEVCLEDQIFVKDPNGKVSVKKHLQSVDPSAEICEFVRYQVGEGMEKKVENFAEEVAKQIS